MSKFMLLLRDEPGFVESVTPSEMQALCEKHAAWSAKLGERALDGRKLTGNEGARVMRASGAGTVVTNGPYGEAKEVMNGYFIIEADDLEHAVHLCSDHPKLETGSIEIRQIDEVPSAPRAD